MSDRPTGCAVVSHVLFFPLVRIVVQGTPPFLVVHTNAAFCHMSGLDSHLVAGKPIADLLSISHSSTENNRSEEEQQAAHTPQGDHAVAETTGLSRSADTTQAAKSISLAQLIATSGFGHINTVQVNTKLRHQIVGRNVTVINNGCEAPMEEGAASGAASKSGAQKRHEESNTTSLTSGSCQDGQDRKPISCRVSIAPIVSASTAMNYCNGLVSDREAEVAHPKGKRAKHHHSVGTAAAAPGATEQHHLDSQHRNKSLPLGETSATAHHRNKAYQPLQFVTHFVIQLQAQGEETNEGSMASLSSNSASVEARMLGLSKEQVQQQRNAVDIQVPPPPPEMEGEILEQESISDTTVATKEPVAAIG